MWNATPSQFTEGAVDRRAVGGRAISGGALRLTTYIPHVVPREQLNSRNSLMSGTHAVTQLGGRPVAGVAVQRLGAPVALLVDAAS